MNLAAIDIGSNAVRLLVARIIENDNGILVKKTCLTRIPLRLGEDTFENNIITAKNIDKLSKTLTAFKLIMELYSVDSFKTIATSALREAKNSKQVINEVFKSSGIKIELIDGRQEANIISRNLETISHFNKTTFVHVDVGGGSTEVNLIKNGKHILSNSFQLGSVRNLKNKDKKSTWKELLKHLDKIKKDICKNTSPEGLGTGGNINKCLKLVTNKTSYSRSVKTADIKLLYKDLEKLSIRERTLKYHLKDDRADVILPALKIYLTIFDHLNIKTINIPKVGLADGLILKIYQDNKDGRNDTNHHS